MDKTRVLVIGCGNMGASHARAYEALDDFELVGVVSRGPESREALSAELGGVATFADAAVRGARAAPAARLGAAVTSQREFKHWSMPEREASR